MNADDTSSEEDPLFGNSLSGLLGCALGTPLPESRVVVPADWVPPAPGHIAVLLPQYKIEHFIGRGGMGAVYKGRQITLNRPVAIKVLPAELAKNVEFVARFHREAQLLASLSHQNIVIIFEFGQTSEGHLFFVMEYVEGMDLHRLLRQAPPDAPQALRITAQICEAMQYAHEMGVIHRDIKPANVLVTPDGRVKLVDFGLATKPTAASGEPEPLEPEEFDPTDPQGLLARRFTRPGSAVGTPDYAAPEVYEGAADERSDIYALGIMLYEMLTGAPPTGYFPLPSTRAAVDERVDGVVVKALAVDPADRYQNAAEMKQAVEQATRPLPGQPGPMVRPLALPPQALEPPQKRRRSGRMTDVFIAGCLVAGGGTAYDGLHQWKVMKGVREMAAAGWSGLAGGPGRQAAVERARQTPLEPVRRKIQRVEGEAMKVVKVTGGKAEPQTDMGEFKAASWSGGGQLWWHDGLPGNSLVLALNVNEPGRQRVKGLFTVSRDSGEVEVSLDGRPVAGSPFNLEAHDTTLAGRTDWGVFDLAAGDHELKLTSAGTRGESTGSGAYCLGLDYVQLEPPVVEAVDDPAGTDVARQAWPSASACWNIDSAKAVNCGYEPSGMQSGDRDLSRVAWFPRKGGMEWVQYEWMEPRKVNECRVFWFDDRHEPGGACALPAYWRVLYREPSGAWVPVDAAIPPAQDDRWNVVQFPAVTATAMRIHLQCQTGWTTGICRWKVLAAGPEAKVPPPAHHDISLCDVPPLHAQVGWDLPHANLYDTELDIREGRTVTLGGRPCTQFLWAHARSYLEYAIPEGCTRFKATGIGPSDVSTGEPAWTGAFKFTVKADGQVLFDSDALSTYSRREAPIDVALPKGAKKLELITGPTVDYTTWAHSLWAVPTFCY